MKALQLTKYGEIKDSLVFNEVNKPTLQPKDVLIEVKAAAINPIDKSIVLPRLFYHLPDRHQRLYRSQVYPTILNNILLK